MKGHNPELSREIMEEYLSVLESDKEDFEDFDEEFFD